MSFSTLTTETQNFLLAQHSYTTKWFLFLSIIFLASYYVFVVWKEHTKTKYITQAISRMFFYGLSIVYLISTPLLLLLMTPEYSFSEFITLPLLFYSIFIGIMFILFFIDLIRYGFFVLLGLAGLDFDDPNVKDIVRQIDNNKHWLKIKKNRNKR